MKYFTECCRQIITATTILVLLLAPMVQAMQTCVSDTRGRLVNDVDSPKHSHYGSTHASYQSMGHDTSHGLTAQHVAISTDSHHSATIESPCHDQQPKSLHQCPDDCPHANHCHSPSGIAIFDVFVADMPRSRSHFIGEILLPLSPPFFLDGPPPKA